MPTNDVRPGLVNLSLPRRPMECTSLLRSSPPSMLWHMYTPMPRMLYQPLRDRRALHVRQGGYLQASENKCNPTRMPLALMPSCHTLHKLGNNSPRNAIKTARAVALSPIIQTRSSATCNKHKAQSHNRLGRLLPRPCKQSRLPARDYSASATSLRNPRRSRQTPWPWCRRSIVRLLWQEPDRPCKQIGPLAIDSRFLCVHICCQVLPARISD